MTPLLASVMSGPDMAYEKYRTHFGNNSVDTEAAMVSALRLQYPSLKLTTCDPAVHDLIGFAAAGKAKLTILDPNAHRVIRQVKQASRKTVDMNLLPQPDAPRFMEQVNDESGEYAKEEGSFSNQVKFGRYLYKWEDQEYLVYLVDGISSGRWCSHYYILCEACQEDEKSMSSKATDRLMYAAASWAMESQDEILVFNHGRWEKDKELFKSVKSTSWEDVILEQEMKTSLVKDVEGFFDAKEIYKDLNVPWKRGIILHGEPGNGKTLSLRALMHGLGVRTPAIPTLYVKTFEGGFGHQPSIRAIFTKARLTAPCLLIFEDIDSLVVETVRSYFLNEVDGLEANDGIMIVATTNHLEKLDPALAHRPSRFDKKCHFPCPKKQERVMYCRYWRNHLAKKNIYAFPDAMCEAIAGITEDFSFAYLKELFLSALLGLARDAAGVVMEEEDVGKELEKLVLWRRARDEAKLLRKDLKSKSKVESKVGAIGEEEDIIPRSCQRTVGPV